MQDKRSKTLSITQHQIGFVVIAIEIQMSKNILEQFEEKKD